MGGEGGEQGFCGEERVSVSREESCGGELEGLREGGREECGFCGVERGIWE